MVPAAAHFLHGVLANVLVRIAIHVHRVDGHLPNTAAQPFRLQHPSTAASHRGNNTPSGP